MATEDPSTMAQLARAVSIRNRWDREMERLVVQAMNEGEDRNLIASAIGRSREHLRTIRRRVKDREREGHAAHRPGD